jgi:hypothetical protein
MGVTPVKTFANLIRQRSTKKSEKNRNKFKRNEIRLVKTKHRQKSKASTEAPLDKKSGFHLKYIK